MPKNKKGKMPILLLNFKILGFQVRGIFSVLKKDKQQGEYFFWFV